MSRSSVFLSSATMLIPLASILFLIRETQSFEWSLLWQDEAWRSSMNVTLYVTITSTILSLIIGTSLARMVYKRDTMLTKLLKLPMFVPHVASAYLFLLLFSGGFPFYGLIEANERHHLVVILTYVWKEVPFVFLMMIGTYRQLNAGYSDMAKTIQLSPFEQFKVAEWPFLIKPLLDSFWILVAFISFAYEVPAILGVTFPKLLGVLAYERMTTGLYLNTNESYAVALVWTVLISSGVVLSYALTGKRRRRIEKGVRR